MKQKEDVSKDVPPKQHRVLTAIADVVTVFTKSVAARHFLRAAIAIALLGFAIVLVMTKVSDGGISTANKIAGAVIVLFFFLVLGVITWALWLKSWYAEKEKGGHAEDEPKKEAKKEAKVVVAAKPKLNRGWKIALSLLAIWLLAEVGLPALARTEWAQRKFGGVSPNYKKQLCEDYTVADYTTKNPAEIQIPLKEACYGNEVILPTAWLPQFTAQLTQTPDGYATVWCNGNSEPRPIRRSGEDITETMYNCFARNDGTTHFRSQGKGLLILRPYRPLTTSFHF